MKIFLKWPFIRLCRYNLLLRSILKETPAEHEDLEAIPAVSEVIRRLEKEADLGAASAEQRIKLRRYNANFIFNAGEHLVCFFYLVRTHAQH